MNGGPIKGILGYAKTSACLIASVQVLNKALLLLSFASSFIRCQSSMDACGFAHPYMPKQMLAKSPAHYWTKASLVLSADLLTWGNAIVMAEGSEFDLNYITERVIGITFHQSCTKQTYQHNLSRITQLLQSKHADRYMVSRPEKQTQNRCQSVSVTVELTLNKMSIFLHAGHQFIWTQQWPQRDESQGKVYQCDFQMRDWL